MAPTLEELYKRAAQVVAERGFAAEYSYRSGAPVDLNRAMHVAKEDLKYPATADDPSILISEWAGNPLWIISRDLGDGAEEEAFAFFKRAARSVDEILAKQEANIDRSDGTERPAWKCEECQTLLERKPGTKPKYCPECREKIEAAKPKPDPWLCEDCGDEIPRKRGAKPKRCPPCKEKHASAAA